MGHVGIAYLLFLVYDRGRKLEVRDPGMLFVLLLGSLFPDLIDKPLAWHLGLLPTGRSLAHSLLFLVPVCLAVYALARHRGKPVWGIAFGIGAISHTLVDAAPVLWDPHATAGFLLYPLRDVEPYGNGSPTVLGLFLDSLSNPYFLSEFVFLGIALLLWRSRGYPGIQAFRGAVSGFRS